MRTLFKLIFQLVAAAVFLFLCLAALIVFDGLKDDGQKADAGLVIGRMEAVKADADQPRLDRAVKLYRDGEFPFIIVSTTMARGVPNDPHVMSAYLENHGVPADVIIEVRPGENTGEVAHEVAEIMKFRKFQSVMVVTDYYHETRVKLALSHEGIGDVQKAHVGELKKEDAIKIGREVMALCDYVAQVYLLPAAEKAKEEAKVGMDKASVDAQQAKEKVDKSLDNMSK